VANATLRPLYRRERVPVPIVEQAGWAPVPGWTGAEYLSFTGIRSPDRPACRKSINLNVVFGKIDCHFVALTMLKITRLHHS